MLKIKKGVLIPIILAAAAILLLFISFNMNTKETKQKDTGVLFTQTKHVLFISSYSESFDTVDLQKQGIRQAFGNSNIGLDILYMDMKKYNTDENEQLFYQSLKYKLAHTQKYDVILLGDDAALTFAEQHQKELFDGVPMVFFCVNDVGHARKAGENPEITGEVEELYLKDTIDVARKLQPAARNMIVLYDNTLTGQGDVKQFMALKDDYPDCTFSGINFSVYSLQEYEAELEKIPEDSIVVYMDAFEDRDGNQYTMQESALNIAAHTKVPVYRTSIGGIDEGILGGKMVSYTDSGYVAGKMVMKILEGTDPADIPVSMTGESSYIFNQQVLKKFGISSAFLPDGSTLMNQDVNYLRKYQKPIMLWALILLTAGCIASALQLILQKNRYVGELLSANRALEETKEKLEESVKEKTRIMSDVSHEIRTPINAIGGLAHLGADAVTDPQAVSYFEKIESSSQYLAEIINDILDFNKTESGSIKIVAEPSSIHEIYDHIRNIITALAEKKNVSFRIDEVNMQHHYVICDRMRVEQILINLLTNAVKFTPKGGKVVLKVSQENTDGRAHMTFEVSDTGCGMSSEFLKHIFTPYMQENRNPSLYGTGTGLGLAISRSLALMMHGDITVVSQENEGSIFTFTAVFELCGKEEIDCTREHVRASKENDAVLFGRRVLMAEDNEINTEVALGILGAFGIMADAVTDGKMALEAFRNVPEGYYDMILMDIRMPVMDGIEATEAIRGLERSDAGTVPILAMSADAFDETLERGRKAGMNDFITKPINPDSMAGIMKKYMKPAAVPNSL